MQARRDLLAKTTDLYESDGSIDEEVVSDLLSEAHGLMGVALRLYDLLGIDEVREIQFPDGIPDEQHQQHLREFIATATSIGSRYGAYSGFRVLHEGRIPKREDLISQPNVDVSDPDGTLLGSWVFTAEDASELRSVLSQSPELLSLQEEGEKFAPFRLAGEIVDGNRRTAVAETVTRLLSFKNGLNPDRQAISVLAALTSDVVAAGEAITALGGEDEPRKLDMQDIQYGVSQLSWVQILPDVGGNVVSKVVHALIDAQTPISTANVADRAGCSTRGMASETNERVFNELETAGLLERDDLGEGKATEWRLCLPFREERQDAEPPLPTMLCERETAPLGGEWRLTDAIFEVFATAADEYGNTYEFGIGSGPLFEATVGPPPERDVSRFVDAYPSVLPIVTLIATLLDAETQLRSDRAEITFGRLPDPDQVTIQAAVS